MCQFHTFLLTINHTKNLYMIRSSMYRHIRKSKFMRKELKEMGL